MLRCRFEPDARARSANCGGKGTRTGGSRLQPGVEGASTVGPARSSGAGRVGRRAQRRRSPAACCPCSSSLPAAAAPIPPAPRRRDPQRGGDLTVLVPRADAAPDPHRVRTLAEAMIHSAVFRGLYVVPPTKEDEPETPDEPSQEGPAPDLAEGPPTVSEDGRVVTVRVRDGVRFGGDGRPDGQRPRRRQGHRARRSPTRRSARWRGGCWPRSPASRPRATRAQELDLRHRGDGRAHAAASGYAGRRRGSSSRRSRRRCRRPCPPTARTSRRGRDRTSRPRTARTGRSSLERNPDFRPLPDDWRRAYAERIRLEVDDSPGRGVAGAERRASGARLDDGARRRSRRRRRSASSSRGS